MKSYISTAAILLLGANVQASQSGNNFKLKQALLSKVQSLESDLKDIDNYLQQELSSDVSTMKVQ
jgi:hypothetical protein